MTIFVIRTTTGREKQVIDRVDARIHATDEHTIKVIFNPHEVRGYIFMEAESRDDVLSAISHQAHVKGLIGKEVSIEELKHFFESSVAQINIQEKDIVEITSGPFKGEKARVLRINKIKEECVVELLEAAVPIPITLKLDAVRVIRREETEQ